MTDGLPSSVDVLPLTLHLTNCSNVREATSPDYRLELGIGRPGWTADLRKHFWMAGQGGRIYDSFFHEITHFS